MYTGLRVYRPAGIQVSDLHVYRPQACRYTGLQVFSVPLRIPFLFEECVYFNHDVAAWSSIRIAHIRYTHFISVRKGWVIFVLVQNQQVEYPF